MSSEAREEFFDKTSGRVLLAVLLLAISLWMGHRQLFSQMQRYDDEGYLLITVQQFLQGIPLYDQLYTQYGPAYYFWQQFLHEGLNIPLSHDATRVVTLVVWIICAALLAVPVWLFTRRILLTSLGAVMAFFHLTQLSYEPGHPQELAFPATLMAIDLVLWRLVLHQRLGVPSAVAVGCFVALSALAKVNVGALAGGGILLGLVTSLGPSPWAIRLRQGLAIVAFAGVPVLMRGDLQRSDIVATIVVAWSGLLAVLIVHPEREDANGPVRIHEVFGFLLGLTSTATLVVLATLNRGTSLNAFIDGLIIWPSRMPTTFWSALPATTLAVMFAFLCLYASLGVRRANPRLQRWTSSFASVWGPLAFALSAVKAYGALFSFAPPTMWLLLRDGSLDAGTRAARRLFAFAAILLILQAYPMPEGTQIVLGTALFLPFALIALADSEREIRGGHAPRRVPRSFVQKAAIVAVLAAALAVVAMRLQWSYARAVPLAMPGAQAVRVELADAARYWWLVTNLQNNCEGFLMGPGINSLHFWTRIPPISALNATLWPLLFDVGQQERLQAAAEKVSRLCVIWEPRIMTFLMDVRGRASNPLGAWLESNFAPVAAFDGWEFRVARNSSRPPLFQGRWLEGGGLALNLPALGQARITQVAVIDAESGTTLGDSARNEFSLVDETSAQVEDLKQGIDLSRARRIRLTGTFATPESSTARTVVRMWDSDGVSVAIVPVVSGEADSSPAERPHD